MRARVWRQVRGHIRNWRRAWSVPARLRVWHYDGFFYGPKTWYHPGEAAANMVKLQQNAVLSNGQGLSSFVHIHDAAVATVALLAAPPGVYNLVDDDPSPQTVWLPAFARFVCAPVPPHISETEATAVAGEDALYYATKLSGASNAKAKRILGWRPRRL